MNRSQHLCTLSISLWCGFALTGCSGGPAPLTADSPIFEGLPRDTVVEVLASPTRNSPDNAGLPNNEAALQGAVRDFLMCRDMYRVYREWVMTGQAPAPEPLAQPVRPIDISDKEMVRLHAEFVGVMKSGEPKQLKETLTATGGCGADVPVKPGDLSGPTIADAVKDL